MRTNAISKRILSVMLALVLVLGMIPVFASAADTTTIYVQPNSNWLNDGARFAAYFFGNGETWVDCVDAGDGLYSVEVPAGYPSVIFCRMNPGTTANSWSNKWNQTKDLTVPTDNKVVYVVDGWDKGAGQWIEKGGELEEIEVVYYLRGDMNGWGVQHPMTKIGDGTYSVTISLAAGTYAYKAADEGWGANWGEGGANGGNLSITVDEDADVTFTLDITAGTLIHDYTPACEHIWGEGSVITAATCTEAGESSFTCTLCGVSKTEPVAALGHNFVDRICTVCGLEKPVLAFYMVGYINGADYGTEGDFENMGEYKFVDGTLKATFTADSYVFIKTEGNANWYMAEAYCQDTTCTFVEGGSEKMFVPGNQALVFTLVENADGSLTLSYAVDPDGCAHEWDEGVETAAPSCTEAGEITYTCGLCGDTKTESVDALGHDYTDGVCGTCGEAEPVVDYYLVGYINGADYGCNDDYENLGEYKFIDGTLVATFDIDSYVFIKTGDNAKWFLTEAYCTDIIGIFVEGGSEKMFVPGGVEITFSLSENPDGSLTMSYSTAEPGVGATVSGTITSFLTDDDVTIELIQDGVVAYSVVASGKSAAYSIVGVADGAYTMKISKANHVALEVEVVISGEDAVFDASIYPLGDANGDGKVNMKDWARMYEHINEVNALTGYAFTSADVNNDGKVNMKDWARLYEHVNEINPLW